MFLEDETPSLQDLDRLPSRMHAAYLALKQAILTGELEPGEQLKEKALAERLGISPTPIREALACLKQEYLVRTVPYQGTYVIGLTREDISDIYSVRRALEGWGAELAAPSIGVATLAELDSLLSFEAEEISKGRSKVHLDTDPKFHSTIIQSSGNLWLLRTTSWFSDHVRRIRSLLDRIPQAQHEMAYAEHREVLAALTQHDAAKARAAMEEHLERAGKRMVEFLVEVRHDSGLHDQGR